MKNNLIQILKTTLIFGLAFLLILAPGQSLLMLTSYLGAISLVFGVISLISKYRAEKKGIFSSKTYIEGIAGILFGIILLNNPENMIKLIVILFAIIALMVSLSQFALYRSLEKSKIKSNLLLISAILSMATAILMFFNPFNGAEIIAVLIGVYILIYGIISLLQLLGVVRKTF